MTNAETFTVNGKPWQVYGPDTHENRVGRLWVGPVGCDEKQRQSWHPLVIKGYVAKSGGAA